MPSFKLMVSTPIRFSEHVEKVLQGEDLASQRFIGEQGVDVYISHFNHKDACGAVGVYDKVKSQLPLSSGITSDLIQES